MLRGDDSARKEAASEVEDENEMSGSETGW